jgi:hypothetical protein
MQELNLILKSKLKSDAVILLADTENYTLMNPNAIRFFFDQQKWFTLNILYFQLV